MDWNSTAPDLIRGLDGPMFTIALCALPVTLPLVLRCWLRHPLSATDRRLAAVDAELS